MTLSLPGPAPAGGVTVTLSVSPTSGAPTFPATVTISAGATSATFDVTSNGAYSGTITATPPSSLYSTASASISITVGAIAPPTVFAAIPSKGFVSGGTEVTIKGDNFTPDATVTIGGAVAAVDPSRRSLLLALRPRARPPDDYSALRNVD